MSRLLTRAALDARRYPEAMLGTLFDAILVDDDVDERTELPQRIMLDHEPSTFVEGYRISRQLWLESGQHDLLGELLRRIGQDGDLDADDRRAFKHVRAKLKHLRFAHAVFGEAHRYPPAIDAVTIALGKLQDGYRLGDRASTASAARRCRLLLSRPARALLRRENDRFRPDDTAGFRTYVSREVAAFETFAGCATVTGAAFHATRKIASRLVSFYSTLLALQPSPEVHRLSRGLAAINGLMGEEHDRLVERRAIGAQDYHRTNFAMCSEVRGRIIALTTLYRSSGLTAGHLE